MFKGITFSESELDLLKNSFHRLDIEKGDTLLCPGERVTTQYYVRRGCLRSFSIDDYGKEHTLTFAIGDWWISDYTAYFSNRKSIMSIECLQQATVYTVSKKEILELYNVVPVIESFFRRKMEKALASFQRRTLANISQSATERYKTFVKTYPQIEQNVKNYHIASYLGITSESLSRIRKEYTQK